jgi:exo-1,4-beta-D-glucosaminidase
VVNDTPEAVGGLTVKAAVFDLGLAQKFSREATIDVAADGVVRAFTLPPTADLTKTYFVRLALADRTGKTISTNFYWLSTQDDVIDWANTKWYYTPTKVHADLTALASLPPTTIAVTATSPAGDRDAMGVVIENTGQALAFQVHLIARDPATGEEILPVFWDDNYFELFPGERREVRVSWPSGSVTGALAITAEAWNAARGQR